jgi:hypothetical protein
MISKSKFGFTFKDSQMFDQMLYADALRGIDSTGVFGVNKYGNLKMMKAAKTSADFLRTKSYMDFSKEIYSSYRMVVGHNRASTRGATVDENAHPFIEDHICLVHNGTLHSHKELADTTVDSHAIAKAIARDGYKEVLPKINGAFALIWFDAKEKKLRIARNSQRPLWVMQSKDIDIIASEPEMLTWLHKRVYGTAGDEAKFFAIEKLYSWDLDDIETGLDTEDMPVKKAPLALPTLPQVKPVQVTAVGTGKISSLRGVDSNPYVGGDRVVFEHVSNSIVGNSVTFRGTDIEGGFRVTATTSLANLTVEQVDELIDGSDYLVGEYLGYSKPKGELTLFLNNVQPFHEYTTCNGHLVTIDQIRNAGHCCDDCGTMIEPEEDDTRFWARVKNGEIKRMLCPTCVEKHPKLHELIKEQDTCTQSESLSLVTSEDLDQYSILQEAYGMH